LQYALRREGHKLERRDRQEGDAREVQFCSQLDGSVWYYSHLNLRIGKEIGRGWRSFNEASFRMKLQNRPESEETDRYDRLLFGDFH
jgi:hypothetical protein